MIVRTLKSVGMSLAFVVGFACPRAEATVFNDVDGSHDIASAAAWGGTIPSAADFTKNYADPLVASADVTFGSVVVKDGARVVFDFLTTPTRTITVTTSKATDSGLSIGSADTAATFLGGNWSMNGKMAAGTSTTDGSVVFSNATVTCSQLDVSGKRNHVVFTGKDARFSATHTGTYPLFYSASDNVFELTDKASWQHDANAVYTVISTSVGCTNNVFRVSKGASYSSTKALNIGYNDTECSNRVEVVDGGVMTVEQISLKKFGSALVVSNGTVRTTKAKFFPLPSGTNCRILLQGKDAQFLFNWTTDTFPLFGGGSDGGVIEIADEAVWSFSSNNMYTAISTDNWNNTFRIARKGKFVSTKDLFVGYRDNERGNRLEVVDGGEASLGAVYVQKTGQSALIRNATVDCTKLVLNNNPKECSITLSGKQCQLRETNMRNEMFVAGSVSNRFLIVDGAKYGHRPADDAMHFYTSVNNSPYGNLLRITGGGQLLCKNGFLHGYNIDHDNGVEVVDGGVIKAMFVSVGGVDNYMVVSNGIVAATNGTMYVGTAWGSNNLRAKLTISGTNSQLTATGSFELSREATINFVVPEDGYVTTPIKAGGDFNIYNGTHLAVDATAFQQKIEKRQKVALAEWMGTPTLSKATLAELTASLAEQKMSVAVEDNKLVLTVRPLNAGLVLLFR